MAFSFLGKVGEVDVPSSPGATVVCPITTHVPKSGADATVLLVHIYYDQWDGSAAAGHIAGAITDDAAYDNAGFGTRWSPYGSTTGGSGSGIPNGRPNVYFGSSGSWQEMGSTTNAWNAE